MKNKLMKGLVLATCMVVNLAHAQFNFQGSHANSCEDLQGNWTGNGKGHNWLVGDCHYHGSGTVSPLDSSGRFTAEVHASKDSGSPMCPNHASKHVVGYCTQGVIKVVTEYGTVKGNYADNAGNLKGTLTISPGMDADVSLKFVRAD